MNDNILLFNNFVIFSSGRERYRLIDSCSVLYSWFFVISQSNVGLEDQKQAAHEL